jgi:hypothetical protein
MESERRPLFGSKKKKKVKPQMVNEENSDRVAGDVSHAGETRAVD